MKFLYLNLAGGILAVVIIGIIIYLVGDKIDSIMTDSVMKKVILTGIAFFILGLVFFIIGHNLKTVGVSLFKPNLKTPEKAVKSFLSSLENGLYERAYNLLSDTAQKLDKIEFIVDTTMQKEMPDVYFHSLKTFEQFWSTLRFSWDTIACPISNCKILADSSAIVEIEIRPSNVGIGVRAKLST